MNLWGMFGVEEYDAIILLSRGALTLKGGGFKGKFVLGVDCYQTLPSHAVRATTIVIYH